MIYLGVGIVGGLSTLSLLVLPRVPAVYTFAFVTQNIWQAAAFATAIGLTLASIGKDNPVASTQYALLQTAVSAPLVYMQWLDGHAYGHRGLTGLYSTDGGLDLAASLAMGGFFLIWMRGARAGRVPLQTKAQVQTKQWPIRHEALGRQLGPAIGIAAKNIINQSDRRVFNSCLIAIGRLRGCLAAQIFVQLEALRSSGFTSSDRRYQFS